MAIDIHGKEFDQGTQIKLHILREYLKEWLPVFTVKKDIIWDKIYIYDFFAGEGSDSVGNHGSPLIILDEIRNYCHHISAKELYLKVVLNEFNPTKSKKLERSCLEHLADCKKNAKGTYSCPNKKVEGECVFRLVIENQDFQDFFRTVYSNMEDNPELPRFMFLDQYGVKHVTEDIFRKLIQLKRTDFIFFISSSFVNRFIENPEFASYLSLTRQEFDERKPYHCHRVIYDYYKSLIPEGSQAYLAPFSIKKGSNIYGLIFGTHHPLGIEKFLNIGWKINPQTGDANFDIDNENINPDEPKLFADQDMPSKLQYFERKLLDAINNRELVTNINVYDFALGMGFLPKHANTVLREMKKKGKLSQKLSFASQNIHRVTEERIFNE